MVDFYSMIRTNIDVMNKLDGFDVIIICCSSQKQADFWQQRLEKGKGSIVNQNSVILAVEEDWKGGAGNALGTLYAFSKASILAKEKYNRDLLTELKSNTISVALYHTAGKGTRLAPLPGSENNNKPGVKLPMTISIDGKKSPVTILESVIKQTGCYSKSRPGRLSVFWGDQGFIPTVAVDYKVGYHVDILCSLGPMLSAEEWEERGMDKYGLIAQSADGNAAQVEKVSHSTAVDLLSHLGEIQSVGVSLGFFSLSSMMLTALLEEFSTELANKTGKLDSDPHLWMPMTLDKNAYSQIMGQKGISEADSGLHYERISTMMKKFHETYSDSKLGVFGPVNVGQGVLWWDYGQLKLYQRNTMIVLDKTQEAEMMRLFFGISDKILINDSEIVKTDVDDISIISSCAIGSDNSSTTGFVRKSVLSNVRCKHIEAENCVLINVTAESIKAKPGSIIYNVCADGKAITELTIDDKDVVVGVFDDEGNQMIIRSHMDTDGGKAWDIQVAGNDMSFSEVHKTNQDACPTTLADVISKTHDEIWSSL